MLHTCPMNLMSACRQHLVGQTPEGTTTRTLTLSRPWPPASSSGCHGTVCRLLSRFCFLVNESLLERCSRRAGGSAPATSCWQCSRTYEFQVHVHI